MNLVVGAGPAGLAVGQALRERGLRCLILERGHTVAPAWHRHYERLHLHTSKRFSSLPGMPFPDHVPTYPSRRQVIEYLQAYAERFDLSPRFGVTVVLATGLNTVPALHSSRYVNGARWAGRRALVVGAGNSGAEIALDLAEHGARAELSVRGRLHVTLRDTLGLPTRFRRSC